MRIPARTVISLIGLLSGALFERAGAQSAIDTAPPRRAHHALAYDPARRVVLLSGGSTPIDSGRAFRFFNDVWSFDGKRWRLLDTSGMRLSGARLAYDAERGRMLSFGGYAGRSLGELRVLEQGRWRTLGAHPEATAAEPGFVYDSGRKRFVLFGGSPLQRDSTTWFLAGDRWTRLHAPSPPRRQAHAMVYDERRGRVVVFGGLGEQTGGGPTPLLSDTWELDGDAWRRRDVSGPSARATAGIAYDSKRGRVILFGGMGADGFLGDTWSWDGNGWTQLATTGPEARAMGYLSYDAHRDRVVLFGGRRRGYPNGDANDSWEWDGSAWKRVPLRGSTISP